MNVFSDKDIAASMCSGIAANLRIIYYAEKPNGEREQTP